MREIKIKNKHQITIEYRNQNKINQNNNNNNTYNNYKRIKEFKKN